jgi:hypothetical protein
MTKKMPVLSVAIFLILIGLAAGSYDLGKGVQSKNLSMSDFSALGVESHTDNAVLGAGAPQAPATDAGTELAIYSDQAPPSTEQGKLMSADVSATAPQYIYYDGNYLGWNQFSAIFPTQPGLWVERAAGWSWYATLPLGGWTTELIYVPNESPLTIYELYPEGYVMSYYLGSVNPGYYYIWFYADTSGRHRNVVSTSSGFSNTVVIDVYSPQPPKPTPPSPKEQCEMNPQCSWANGQCYCRGLNPDNPEKDKCEQNPQCDWVNGQCYCRGLIPEDPEKAKCEQNPQCSWANGQCLCRGLNPPEPGPMPSPTPGPSPEQQSCEENPSCHWSAGHCYCTGLGSSSSSIDIEESSDLLGSSSLGSV